MCQQLNEVRNIGGWITTDDGFSMGQVEELRGVVVRQCGEEVANEVGVMDGSARDLILG